MKSQELFKIITQNKDVMTTKKRTVNERINIRANFKATISRFHLAYI